MIDISAEHGWLATVLRTQQLMQCVVQARWHDDSPLMTLPYVEDYNISCFKKIMLKQPIFTLPGLKYACSNKYEQLAGPLREAFEEPQIENIFKVLCDMPTLNISIVIKGQLHENEDACRPVKQPMTKDDWLEVHQDQEYTIQVNFNRIHNVSPSKKSNSASAIPKVHCPKFPKGKDEGWFLTLGDPFNGELIALKRCAYRSAKSSHQISFITPQQIGRSIYTLYVISDAYLGWDQQYNINLDVVARQEVQHESEYYYDVSKL